MTFASVFGVVSVPGVPSPTSPSAATLLQYTMRSTPACCADSSRARVPSTLARFIASGSGTQSR